MAQNPFSGVELHSPNSIRKKNQKNMNNMQKNMNNMQKFVNGFPGEMEIRSASDDEERSPEEAEIRSASDHAPTTTSLQKEIDMMKIRIDSLEAEVHRKKIIKKNKTLGKKSNEMRKSKKRMKILKKKNSHV